MKITTCFAIVCTITLLCTPTIAKRRRPEESCPKPLDENQFQSKVEDLLNQPLEINEEEIKCKSSHVKKDFILSLGKSFDDLKSFVQKKLYCILYSIKNSFWLETILNRLDCGKPIVNLLNSINIEEPLQCDKEELNFENFNKSLKLNAECGNIKTSRRLRGMDYIEPFIAVAGAGLSILEKTAILMTKMGNALVTFGTILIVSFVIALLFYGFTTTALLLTIFQVFIIKKYYTFRM